MKSDRELLAKLYHARGWCWWRVKRSAKNGNKSGYQIQTDTETKFVTVSELPEFAKRILGE